MAQYAIWACDNIYGGLHGMNYSGVINADTLEEALDYAQERAIEVTQSYSCIESALEDEYVERVDENTPADEAEMIRCEIIFEDIEYNAVKVTKEGFSTKELDELCYNIGFEEFVKECCK